MKSLPQFNTELHHRMLRNGANVFLFERKGMPIYIRATFFAGSRFDKIPGTAHFLEHMLIAGSEGFPSKNLIADYLQKIGGDFSASTTGDFLRLNVEIAESQDIEHGIKVLEECLTKPLLDPKTIENERGAILSELKSRKSNPKEYIVDVSRSLVMQGTPLEFSNLGAEEDIKSISRENLAEFLENHIHSGTATFIVAGDIEIDVLTDGLNKINLPIKEKVEVGSPLPIVRDKKRKIESYPGVNQLQVSMSNRTSIDDYKEYCALSVLNQILGVGRGSRLMTKLRYEKGLVYSVWGNVIDAGDWGIFRIQFSCDLDNFDNTKEIIFNEFDSLRESGVLDNELSSAKSKISKGSKRQLQTSESWITAHEASCVYHPDTLKTIGDYAETIQRLTSDDIKIVASKYLIKDDFLTAICGDLK